MIPVIFGWDSVGNGVHMIIWLVSSRSNALGIAICVQWKVLEASSSTAASCNSQWCHGGRWLCHGLWFHRLSWTVAATVHVALTVLGVWVGIFGAPPLLAVGPPASTWFRIHLLAIESAIAHYRIILKMLSKSKTNNFVSSIRQAWETHNATCNIILNIVNNENMIVHYIKNGKTFTTSSVRNWYKKVIWHFIINTITI